MDETNPLSALRPAAPAADNLTVNDVNSYDFGMSPEEMVAWEAQKNQQQPVTGAQNTTDYYPGFSNQGASGNYSGSVIGSASLFGGGAALVPQGMFDAQDAAIQRAALGKAKEVADFRKQFKAPTSKLTNINDNLTQEYFKHQQDSWSKALKKANGDSHLATQILRNDPEFFAKTKSFEDRAKLGDSIVNTKAQNDLDIRTGKFTPTPTYLEAERKLYKALNPNDPEFKNLANVYRTMQVERDFSDSLDQVTKRAFANEIGDAGVSLDDPEFIKKWKSSKKEWSPEQIDGFAKTLKDNFFFESDYWTDDRIKRNVENMLRGKVTTKDVNATQKRADDGGGDMDYTTAQPLAESQINVADPSNPQGTPSTIYGLNVYKTNAKHENQEISIPISKDMVDAQGKKYSNKTGHITGSVVGIQNGYYDKRNNMFLDKEQTADFLQNGKLTRTFPDQAMTNEDDIEMRPVAVVNVEPQTRNRGVTSSQNTVLVNVNEIKGKFKNLKKKPGQKDFDDLIDENIKLAEEDNNKRKKQAEPAKAAPATEVKADKKVEDLRKKYKY